MEIGKGLEERVLLALRVAWKRWWGGGVLLALRVAWKRWWGGGWGSAIRLTWNRGFVDDWVGEVDGDGEVDTDDDNTDDSRLVDGDDVVCLRLGEKWGDPFGDMPPSFPKMSRENTLRAAGERPADGADALGDTRA
jgi:hypothetical protein